jgi:hypothetical protein
MAGFDSPAGRGSILPLFFDNSSQGQYTLNPTDPPHKDTAAVVEPNIWQENYQIRSIEVDSHQGSKPPKAGTGASQLDFLRIH